MNFLTPLAFGLAALLPVIIAFYILKLRREEQTVASIYLWQEMVRDVAANAPWQRLRPNWLLLLQLLALIGLILALAQPFTWTVATGGSHLILVMDTSASMGATDVTPDRLTAATVQAQRMARDLPPSVPVTLITAGTEVQVALSHSSDRGMLDRALNAVRGETGEADIATALELAAAVAGGDPEAEIVLLSDGGGRIPDQLTSGAQVRYLPIGASSANQAISALSLDAGAAGQAWSAFARITNYDEQAIQRRLTLYAHAAPFHPEDGVLVAARDLMLPAGEAVALTLPDLPAGTVAVEARLQGEDVLAADDRAWAVAPLFNGAQIQIVGPGNRFLELALALLPGVEVTTLSLADYEATWHDIENTELPAPDAAWLTIFDAVLPEQGHYPPGALFFVGPLHSTDFFSVTGAVETTAVRPATVADPLLAYVDVRDVIVQEAARIPLPDWGRPVIIGDDGGEGDGKQTTPLLIVGEEDGRRLAVLAFDLRRSDLPLRTAFPLLLSNVVGALAPGATGPLPVTLTPGQPLEIPLPPQAEAAVVVQPNGAATRLPAGEARPLFSETTESGVYEIEWETAGETYPLGRLAVSLFNPLESDVTPRTALVVTGGGEQEFTAERPERQPWWRPLAWTALVVLGIEWLVQYRSNLTQALKRRPDMAGALGAAGPTRRSA